MEVEAIAGETLVKEPEALVERGRGEKYAFQVKLENVEFAFDERQLQPWSSTLR